MSGTFRLNYRKLSGSWINLNNSTLNYRQSCQRFDLMTTAECTEVLIDAEYDMTRAVDAFVRVHGLTRAEEIISLLVRERLERARARRMTMAALAREVAP